MAKTEPRVFVLQKQSKYDIDAVKHYSKELIYIIEDERISPFDTYNLIELASHKITISEFDPDVDLICLTGPSVLLSLFLAVFANRFHFTKLKVLIFDARLSKYKLRILDLGV